MLILFQKYHKQLNLTLLALLGLSCGLLASALLDYTLVSSPTHEMRRDRQTTERTTGLTQHDLNLILQRNIFDPEHRSTANFSLDSAPATAATQQVQARQDDLTLFGTVVADGKSLALLRVGKERDTYHLGSLLPGNRQIEEIRRNMVKIRNPDQTVTTLQIAEESSATSSASQTASPRTGSNDIKQVDENRWLISREMAEQKRQNLAEELQLARVQPRLVDGQTNGVVIRMLRSNSLLNKLGLRRGDVIMSVNNMALNSPEKILQVVQQLREATRIDLSVERRGEIMNLAYELD